jgi:hypothetical protein
MEPKIKIDGNKFYGRLEKIHKLWKNQVCGLFNYILYYIIFDIKIKYNIIFIFTHRILVFPMWII